MLQDRGKLKKMWFSEGYKSIIGSLNYKEWGSGGCFIFQNISGVTSINSSRHLEGRHVAANQLVPLNTKTKTGCIKL